VVGIVTALVLIFILANLLVDVLYAVIDPRIRYR
jgi:peptide/nickel transport system permease protein/oligopeptide transport system permease protein